MRTKFKVLWGILAAIVVISVLPIILTLFTSELAGNDISASYSGRGSSGSPAMEASSSFGLSRNKMQMEGEAMMDAVDEDYYGGDDTNNGGDGDEVDRMIVRTGTFSLTVEDVQASVDQISQYAKEKGGYVVSSKTEKVGLAPVATVKIRVPADVFEEGINTIKNIGTVESEHVRGDDVTEEYVDLEARMGNLKATEEQYLEIMKKAKEVEDILKVQQYLSGVRESIERLEGRMKYLRENASMSTITIYLATKADNLPVIDDREKWEPIAVLKNSVRGIMEVAKSLSYFVIWFVVFIPLWALIIFVIWTIRKAWRKFRRKDLSPTGQQ